MLLPFYNPNLTEAGCDEAGRGCLAGPVFAAAVILPKNFNNNNLNDSKQLTERQRKALRIIIEKESLAYAVYNIDNKTIDKINILNASIEAMNKSIAKLKIVPELLLIDGNRFHTSSGIKYKCIIKGDGIYMSIAAASVLAKTYRDEYMENLDKLHPEYEWNKNKGYPTLSHRKAIEKYGISPYHRTTYKPCMPKLF